MKGSREASERASERATGAGGSLFRLTWQKQRLSAEPPGGDTSCAAQPQFSSARTTTTRRRRRKRRSSRLGFMLRCFLAARPGRSLTSSSSSRMCSSSSSSSGARSLQQEPELAQPHWRKRGGGCAPSFLPCAARPAPSHAPLRPAEWRRPPWPLSHPGGRQQADSSSPGHAWPCLPEHVQRARVERRQPRRRPKACLLLDVRFGTSA